MDLRLFGFGVNLLVPVNEETSGGELNELLVSWEVKGTHTHIHLRDEKKVKGIAANFLDETWHWGGGPLKFP